MSMSKKSAPWLWEMLMWECPLHCGRTAFLPESGILVSAIKTTKQNGEDMHVMKIVTSGATVGHVDEDEEEVVTVTARRQAEDGSVHYETNFTSGVTHWLPASSFINDDGTATLAWLAFVGEEEIQGAFQHFTTDKLKVC